MNQTRLGSLIEACLNTAIGAGINMIGQLVIFPAVGIDIPFLTNLMIAAFFTVLSVARGYVLRRWFNGRLHAAAHRLARVAS